LFFFGYSAFYFAQLKVPIANATVLFLVTPFFITIMSIIVFGSLGGTSRWITMIIGFSGVIVVVFISRQRSTSKLARNYMLVSMMAVLKRLRILRI
jgi:drug/metabolite transporter (DMT)-like permease